MFEEIRANQRRTVVLVILMAAILLALGYLLAEMVASGAGPLGLVFAFLLWVILSLVSYFGGDQIFLALSGAKKIEKSDHPILFNVVEEMTLASGTAKIPEIYVIDDAALNAFATGRDQEHAALAVTSGLLQTLSRDELQGVVAHEIGHIRNRDILYMMMVGVMLGAIVMLADFGGRYLRFGAYTRTSPRRSSRGGGQIQALFLILAILLIILAPLLAQLIYFAVSRKREYLADACSAAYTRYPDALADALEKIGHSTARLRTASQATAPMFIVNPLKLTARGMSDLTSTHPPISERVRILRSMGGLGDLAGYENAFRRVTGRAVGTMGLAPATESAAGPAMRQRARPPLMDRVIPSSPMSLAGTAAVAAAVAADEPVARVRQTTDMLWKKKNYIFIECPCETRLKLPPEFAGRTVTCPHCGRPHLVAAPPARRHG